MVDGFEELEAIAVIDLLRRAGVEVWTAGLAGLAATGKNGVTVKTDVTFPSVAWREFDAIVVPGGPGVKALLASRELEDSLRRHALAGKLIAAICAAPLVLAKAGLLDGKRVACFPGVEQDLAGVVLVREPVVQDGRIITSRGAGTSILFALAVVAELLGPAKAAEIAESIVHPSQFIPTQATPR
jgi:4-methyl-5(b-hydroxyethyl)-thiazole monophosphate biosynthesis